MPLLALPNELILQIARCLLQSTTVQCDCDCHCHHISTHLSAFFHVNHRLHALLAEYLLATASTLHVLFWAVANSRIDIVALALERGTDPNSTRRPNAHITASRYLHSTPVDLAIAMRVHSVDSQSHALKLRTLALLFAAGGTCTVDNLIKPTRYGDLDLLTLCLAHLTDTEDCYSHSGLRTILEIASRRGHVEAAKLAIAAGATVNSTGVHNDPGFYPPLWVCCNAPIRTLQVLLDAGADPTWRARHGVSVVQNMRERSVDSPELEEKIALLVRYGAVDERPVWRGGRRPPGQTPEMEYRGWVPGSRETPVDWAQVCVLMGREEGCRCSRG